MEASVGQGLADKVVMNGNKYVKDILETSSMVYRQVHGDLRGKYTGTFRRRLILHENETITSQGVFDTCNLNSNGADQ